MNRLQPEMPPKGHVILVGAGPGDPGLLTLRGKKALEGADVVLYDHLAHPDLLGHAPPGAERIDVGKVRGHPRLSQREIESVLIDRASRGLSVVRLKGGDPFVFGRGGEEGQALEKAGIPYTVIPGVTSVTASPAYAGLPVSHRETNSRIVVMTGHDDPEKLSPTTLDALALPDQTLVILMGVEHFRKLVPRLLEHRMPPDTPVVAVRWGTTAFQEVREGTMHTITRILDENPVRPPATIVIGRVAGKDWRLDWQRNRPLFGKRILLTREKEAGGILKDALENLGAEVVSCPVIEIRSVTGKDESDLDNTLQNISGFGWILFLSPNGVRYFFRRMQQTRKDIRSLSGCQIFSMGPSTTRTLNEYGIHPDASPLESHANGVLEFFRSQIHHPGQRCLLVRGDRGDRAIPDGLSDLGFEVRQVTAYENRMPDLPEYLRERVAGGFENRDFHLAVFYSPSAYKNLVALLTKQAASIRETTGLAIGPTTADALRKDGVQNIIVASEPTDTAVLTAVLQHFS